jgi:hypothetical protein
MRITTCAAVVVAAMVASPAFAQPTVDSFSELSKVVKKGQVVFVEDEAGQRVKGNITELSDSSLQLMTTGVGGREVTLAGSRITRVSRVDSRVNGFLIGAAIGVGAGIYSGSMIDMLFENEASNADFAYPLFGALMGLAGGGIGYAIDGAIDGQQLVFARRGLAPQPQVRVSPFAAAHGRGVRLSIDF